METPEEALLNVSTTSIPKQKKGSIETLLRTTSRNHIDMGAMADTKSNIIISICAIIISLIIGVLIQKNTTEIKLFWIPIVILLASCLIALIFATLATRPDKNKGFFSKEEALAQEANPLHFGSFYMMSYQEYEEIMQTILTDSEYIHRSMIRDIYQYGKALGKKYQLLRISYTVFMVGLVLAAFSLGIVLGINT